MTKMFSTNENNHKVRYFNGTVSIFKITLPTLLTNQNTAAKIPKVKKTSY